jgi:hypothetical protein
VSRKFRPVAACLTGSGCRRDCKGCEGCDSQTDEITSIAGFLATERGAFEQPDPGDGCLVHKGERGSSGLREVERGWRRAN